MLILVSAGVNIAEMATFEITTGELIKEATGKKREFPKYTTQLLNLANQNSGGTRPRVVGQLSDLIQECPDRGYKGWKEWYLKKHPMAIDDATERVYAMVQNLKGALPLITKDMVREWVEDLVIDKTYAGLRVQEAILKRVAAIKKCQYRAATPSEESKGIDGYIGDKPISIKPATYETKNMLNEKIAASIVFYEKTKTGIKVDLRNFD